MISAAESHATVDRLLETAGLTHGKGMQSYLPLGTVRLFKEYGK